MSLDKGNINLDFVYLCTHVIASNCIQELNMSVYRDESTGA
jgi:hypothetical protein